MEDDFVIITCNHSINVDNKSLLNMYYQLLPSKKDIKSSVKKETFILLKTMDKSTKYFLHIFFKNKRRLKYYYYNIK